MGNVPPVTIVDATRNPFGPCGLNIHPGSTRPPKADRQPGRAFGRTWLASSRPDALSKLRCSVADGGARRGDWSDDSKSCRRRMRHPSCASCTEASRWSFVLFSGAPGSTPFWPPTKLPVRAWCIVQAIPSALKDRFLGPTPCVSRRAGMHSCSCTTMVTILSCWNHHRASRVPDVVSPGRLLNEKYGPINYPHGSGS